MLQMGAGSGPCAKAFLTAEALSCPQPSAKATQVELLGKGGWVCPCIQTMVVSNSQAAKPFTVF